MKLNNQLVLGWLIDFAQSHYTKSKRNRNNRIYRKCLRNYKVMMKMLISMKLTLKEMKKFVYNF